MECLPSECGWLSKNHYSPESILDSSGGSPKGGTVCRLWTETESNNGAILPEEDNRISFEVRQTVFGNTGTMMTVRIGHSDAELLAKEFVNIFISGQFVELDRCQFFNRLLWKLRRFATNLREDSDTGASKERKPL